jgi:hypothetical protein
MNVGGTPRPELYHCYQHAVFSGAIKLREPYDAVTVCVYDTILWICRTRHLDNWHLVTCAYADLTFAGLLTNKWLSDL